MNSAKDLEECVTFYAEILPQPAIFDPDFQIWRSKWCTIK